MMRISNLARTLLLSWLGLLSSSCIDVGHEAEVGCLADLDEPGCSRELDRDEAPSRPERPDEPTPPAADASAPAPLDLDAGDPPPGEDLDAGNPPPGEALPADAASTFDAGPREGGAEP